MEDKPPTRDQLQEELARLRRQLGEAQEAADRQQGTQEALRESEARYRLLFESSPDAVVLYAPDGRVLHVNQAFVDTYGWSREEWLGRRIDFVAPGEGKKTRQAIATAMAGRKMEMESRRLTKDGRVLDVHISVAPFQAEQGGLTGIYVIHRDITDKKRAEEALRESQARYRLLLDASPDPITVYDAQGRVTYVNPAFEETFGWRQAELAGRGIDFVPPHEMERTREAVRRTLEGEKVFLESQRLTKDGRLLDIQLKTAIFTDPQGNLAGDIVIYRDITQQKKAAEALRASQERHLLLLDASPDPITVYDAQGQVTYVNPAFTQTFGWSQAELAGRGIDFVPPHEMERTREAVQRTLRGENVLLESQRLTKDGRLLDIQLRTAIFRDPQGNLAGDIVIYRDISQRKRAEEELKRHRDHLEELVAERTLELRQANRELQQAIEEHQRTAEALLAAQANYLRLYEESSKVGALYRSLFDSSADAIIVYDLAGRVQFLNQAFTNIFGWSQEELANRRLDFVPASEQEATRRKVSAVMGEGQPRREFQTRRYTKDGRLLEVEISASRFDDHQGRPAGMVVIIRDTTERIRAQAEKERLEQQLRQALKMEAVGVLASGIAHDFNNILQAVSGYLQLMLASQEHSLAFWAGQIQEMDRLLQRGGELVRGLLTFGRKMMPQLSPLNLNQVIASIVAVLERTIPPMIRIETRLAPDLWEIAGDANQVEHLLVNLAGNARDAMPEGGRLLIETSNETWDEVSLRHYPDMAPGRYVLLKVADSGLGMDPETQQHIFEPFFTTKGVGVGTGLGLSTVYGIVKGHGGHITCYSTPGQGTVFNIHWPVLERPEAQALSPAPAPENIPGGQETILLVDDEPAIVEVAREMLERQGYTVLTALSGEEALAAYDQASAGVDLVILDLGMPGMGGHRALDRLRQMDPLARVIVASGYSDSLQIDRCLRAGAAEFIAKPYRLQELLKKVREVLDRRR